MTRIIKVDPSEGMESLDRSVSELPLIEDELAEEMMRHLFPLLDMKAWTEHLLGCVPPGMATSFGAVAEALGSMKASRAVGELIASGDLKGPTHRVVYFDRTVHPSNVRELSEEIPFRDGATGPRVDEGRMVRFDLEKPPLMILSKLQDSIHPILREEHPGRIDLVAGIDISSKDDIHVSAMSIMDLEGGGIEGLCLRGSPGLPYVSGLLFYREAPMIFPLISKALQKDLIDLDTLCVLDGNGTIHPRRMGIACQVGASLGVRTCGIAKRLLLGTVSSEGERLGNCSVSAVMYGDERIGSAFRTGGSSRPVYVSRGHRIDQRTVDRTISAMTLTRVPEPTKCAHELANRCRSETPS
ncbi:MAG: endonuclease V [Candidatus Thermoplasmatota archaeon]|nr:endonuclease V [Candidatus Thermoplasmatota archaeon]